MALAGSGAQVRLAVCGRKSRSDALEAARAQLRAAARTSDWNPGLVTRLQAYASGAPDDFRDVELDLDDCTPFERRVLKHCREIPYGHTCSYGELAKRSGSSRAARAVGTIMAACRFPLLVPCHRVVRSGGDRGRLTGSAAMRHKLRQLEAHGESTPKSSKRGSRKKPKSKGLRSGKRLFRGRALEMKGSEPRLQREN